MARHTRARRQPASRRPEDPPAGAPLCALLGAPPAAAADAPPPTLITAPVAATAAAAAWPGEAVAGWLGDAGLLLPLSCCVEVEDEVLFFSALMSFLNIAHRCWCGCSGVRHAAPSRGAGAGGHEQQHPASSVAWVPPPPAPRPRPRGRRAPWPFAPQPATTRTAWRPRPRPVAARGLLPVPGSTPNNNQTRKTRGRGLGGRRSTWFFLGGGTRRRLQAQGAAGSRSPTDRFRLRAKRTPRPASGASVGQAWGAFIWQPAACVRTELSAIIICVCVCCGFWLPKPQAHVTLNPCPTPVRHLPYCTSPPAAARRRSIPYWQEGQGMAASSSGSTAQRTQAQTANPSPVDQDTLHVRTGP